MLGTQLAQLATLVPTTESGKIPGQPEPSIENVKAVTMRGDKSTRNPPYPNHAGKNKESKGATPLSIDDKSTVHKQKTAFHEFCDTNILPFP